jgi:hexosaminidase
MTEFVLDCFYRPAADLKASRQEFALTNTSAKPLKDFKLAYTALTRAAAGAVLENAASFCRIANFHEITPLDGEVLEPGATWRFAITGLANVSRHRLDGPKSAYIATNGRVTEVLCNDLEAPADLDTGERKHLPVGKLQDAVHIVPWPQKTDFAGFTAKLTGYLVASGTIEEKAAAAKISALTVRLFPDAPHPFRFTESHHLAGLTFAQETALPRDGYRLTFSGGAAALTYGGAAGRDYGLTVLAQIATGAYRKPGQFLFPLDGRIEDRPRFSWRGTHLDVSRHFRGPGDILRLLDILAWGRMNIFQWHLTDDEGWRLEIKAYPELTVGGARRGPGCQQVPQLGFAADIYEGAYSQAEVQEIVSHAASLNIDILPEIDVPGHSTAVLKTYPHLADQAETPESYHSIQGYPNNALNPAMKETYVFLEKVFAEVAALFPFEFIHIGGDEVDVKSWLASPKTRRLMQDLNLKDTMEVQAYFMGRVRDILKKLGRKLAGWDEVSHGGGIDPDGVLLMAWQKQQVTKELIDEGYDVICTPGQHYYMDMAQASGWHEPGAGWAGVSTPEACYKYEPSDGLTPGSEDRLKGVQACIWCEHMTSNTIFNHMVFPRLFAVAEAGWTNPPQKDWHRFAAQAPFLPLL